MTPTARSTKWLRDRGWIVAKVEQRLHMPKAPYPITRDAFNFGDLLAALPSTTEEDGSDGGIALIQVTGGQGGNLMARVRKIMEEPEIAELAHKWLKSGGWIFAHGWAKRGARGKPKRWTLKIKSIEHSCSSADALLESRDIETPT
jgi:hypothetical protein